MLRLPWRVRQGAELEGLGGGEEVEGAVEAGGQSGEDDAGLALETLGAAVDQGDDGGEVVGGNRVVFFAAFGPLGEGEEGAVEPDAGFDIVEACDNDGKLLPDGEREEGGGKRKGRYAYIVVKCDENR